MTDRWARFSRGWLISGFATYAAAFSHVAAGGGHPPAFAIALALAFSGPVCIMLAGRRLAVWRLALAVGLSQLAYHSLFAFFGPATVLPGTPLHTTGHHNHGTVTLPTTPATAGTDAVFSDPVMIATHLGAAIATLGAVLYAERTARAIVAAARPVAASCARATVRGLRAALAAEAAPVFNIFRLSPERRERLPVPDLAPLIGFLRHRGPPMGARA